MTQNSDEQTVVETETTKRTEVPAHEVHREEKRTTNEPAVTETTEVTERTVEK